jgi:hypothetical protein
VKIKPQWFVTPGKQTNIINAYRVKEGYSPPEMLLLAELSALDAVQYNCDVRSLLHIPLS